MPSSRRMSASTANPSLSGYHVVPGGYDELITPTGETRPAWQALSRVLARLDAGEIADRQRQADRLIEAEGASYLFHDDAQDTSRPWKVDPLPLVIAGGEWAHVERSIAQRVTVLNKVVADLYGEMQLLRRRIVPPAAAFGAPGYIVSATGTTPPKSRWITSYAADLIRLSDGRWHVLRDLADAPSGAGYALVNRTVSSQLFPDVVRELAPMSLTGFFADMRSALDASSPPDRSSPRTVVLSPGYGDASYFEHSYLAAHLGYHLAEMGDLIVRHGRVWLRALGGLEAVDVLLRRVGSDRADPLESRNAAGGVPGLARAGRTGSVGIANAIGSGLGSSMSLIPYLADAARHFGEELSMPAVPTLWCGESASRTRVLDAPERFVLHDLAGAGPQGGESAVTAFGSHLDATGRDHWRALIQRQPHRVVAQEKVAFATAPVVGPHGLQPGTAVLRVLAVVGRNGVSVLPGGLARVMDPAVPIVNQTSGSAKDVWVLDDRLDTARRSRPQLSRSMPQVDLRESLPTRAAEAMFWVGRSAERAEAIARSAEVALSMVQTDPSLLTALDGGWRRPVVAALSFLVAPGMAAAGEQRAETTPADEFRSAIAAALSDPAGLPGTLGALSRAAGSARQFLSATTWRVLGELRAENDELAAALRSANDAGLRRRLDTVLVRLSSLSGLFNESIVRGPAWRFLEIGRRIDRALCLITTIENVVAPANPQLRGSLFDYVLSSNESLVAYRRRYRSDSVLDALVDLLVLDDTNPRALAFQLDQLRHQVTLLPDRDATPVLARTIDEASAAVVEMSWLPADADQVGVNGRREVVDRFAQSARAPLLAFGQALNGAYFNDPTRIRRVVQATS